MHATRQHLGKLTVHSSLLAEDMWMHVSDGADTKLWKEARGLGLGGWTVVAAAIVRNVVRIFGLVLQFTTASRDPSLCIKAAAAHALVMVVPRYLYGNCKYGIHALCMMV